MNLKKLLAILLAAIMCATVFTACTPSDNQENGSESESTSESSKGDTDKEEDKKPVERFDYFNNDVSQFISINVSDYKGTTVTIDKMFEATDEGVMAYIDMLCNEYKVLSSEKITDRPVKKGDVVMLYYEGYKDGVAFQGGSNMNDTKPYQLEIGSGAFIPGFEDALIGIVPSETGRDNLVDLNLTFPKDYHSAELAGKDVVFKVYIEYISEYVPAEYNEDFITKTLKYETKDSDIKASFEKYIKDEILPSIRKTEILNSIWDNLFDKAVIKSYPQSEVDYYYNSYVEQYESYKKYYEQFGMKFASLDEFVIRYLGLEEGADWKKVTREQSEIDVTQNLIFHYIAQQENITLTQTDYQNSLNYYVNYYKNQGYNYTAAQIEENLGSRLIKENALFDKVQTLLADSCNVIYKDTAEEEPEEETTETETEIETETEVETEA